MRKKELIQYVYDNRLALKSNSVNIDQANRAILDLKEDFRNLELALEHRKDEIKELRDEINLFDKELNFRHDELNYIRATLDELLNYFKLEKKTTEVTAPWYIAPEPAKIKKIVIKKKDGKKKPKS